MRLSSIELEKNFLGFIGDTEILPIGFDRFNSKMKLRQLFLNLANNSLKKYCNFSKYEQYKLSKVSLMKAFTYKIKTLMPISYVKTFKRCNGFNFCKESTIIINAYQQNRSSLINANKSQLQVAKLISLCFVNSQLQIILDKNLLFHEFVLNKIKRLHKDKNIEDYGDSISIKGEGVSALKIYTSWKDIETTKPNIQEELEHAITSIKKDGYLQVYLVYPKDHNFKRHIPIFVDELEENTYKIKAIPYSMRSTLRNKL